MHAAPKAPKVNLELKVIRIRAYALFFMLFLALLGYFWKTKEAPLDIAAFISPYAAAPLNITAWKPIQPEGGAAAPIPKVEKVTIEKQAVQPITKDPVDNTPQQVTADSSNGNGKGNAKGENIGEGEGEGVFMQVEQMPRFPGDLAAYIQRVLKYPTLAKIKNLQGTVALSFVINEEGKPTDISIVKPLGLGCDQEAARVVAAMPNWIPGKRKGKPVKVLSKIEIKFTLFK